MKELRLWLIVVVVLTMSSLVQGQPPAKEPTAEELVNRLSSPSFQEREAAAKALRALGTKAVPALNAGLMSRSADGVQQCRRVLAAIRKDDLDRFLKAFAADTDRKAKFDHPVWQRWAKVAGGDRPSRELFTEVLAVAGAAEALDQLEADPKAAADVYPAELTRLRTIAAPRVLEAGRPAPPVAVVLLFSRRRGLWRLSGQLLRGDQPQAEPTGGADRDVAQPGGGSVGVDQPPPLPEARAVVSR